MEFYSAPHLAHPEGCAALRIVLVTVPRVNRSCEHFPDGSDLHLLRESGKDLELGEGDRGGEGCGCDVVVEARL